MQRLHLSKVFGAGVLLASFAVLPLLAPSAARSEDMRGMSKYEMGRHVGPEAMREDAIMADGSTTSSRQMMMYSNSSPEMMSRTTMGRMMMGNMDPYYQGMSNYEMGRHVLPEPMRMDSSEMMRRQSIQGEITTPSRQSSTVQQDMPGSTMQPSGTMQQDMPGSTMQPGGTMQQTMPSGTQTNQ